MNPLRKIRNLMRLAACSNALPHIAQEARQKAKLLADRHGIDLASVDVEDEGVCTFKVKGRIDDIALSIAGQIVTHFWKAKLKAVKHPMGIGVNVVVKAKDYEAAGAAFRAILNGCRVGYANTLEIYRMMTRKRRCGGAGFIYIFGHKPHRRSWMIGFCNGVAKSLLDHGFDPAEPPPPPEKFVPPPPNPLALAIIPKPAPKRKRKRAPKPKAEVQATEPPTAQETPPPQPEPEQLDHWSASEGFQRGMAFKL